LKEQCRKIFAKLKAGVKKELVDGHFLVTQRKSGEQQRTTEEEVHGS
jgi:hypothetical protein